MVSGAVAKHSHLKPQAGSRESYSKWLKSFDALDLAPSDILPPPGPYLLILFKQPPTGD